MLVRLRQGEDPLAVTKAKWADIYAHLRRISDYSEYNMRLEDGSNNCALCEVFFSFGPDNCNLCPIMKNTGKPQCRGTPYIEYFKAERKNDLPAMRHAAFKMYSFLRSLEEQGEKRWEIGEP